MRRTYKPLFWRATRPVNSTDCMIAGRYCLKRIIINIFTLCFIKYFHSFIQYAVFTGRVARQNNGLYVLRMIVKLAYINKNRATKYWPTRSLDWCTESVIIGSLLEVKGDSVKAFNFYMDMEHSGRWKGCKLKPSLQWSMLTNGGHWGMVIGGC